MKIWCLSTKRVQYLYTYICYCEEDPTKLIMSPEYEEVYAELMNDLYDSFSYLYCDSPDDEDTEDWTDEDWEDFYNEQYNEFCDGISFEAYETNEQEAERFPVLIDER